MAGTPIVTKQLGALEVTVAANFEQWKKDRKQAKREAEQMGKDMGEPMDAEMEGELDRMEAGELPGDGDADDTFGDDFAGVD